eukprot:3143747-Karenia_brevis.AAC.1
MRKLETIWFDGTWLGVHRRTHEHLIANESGAVVKARSIRRRPLPERWSADAIEKLKGTPTKPNPRIEVGEAQAAEDPIAIE